MSLYDQLEKQYNIDAGRCQRGNKLSQQGTVQVTVESVKKITSLISGRHAVAIEHESGQPLKISCSCQDWCTRGLQADMPCKHIVALAVTADVQGVVQHVVAKSPTKERQPQPQNVPPAPVPTVPFTTQVSQAIATAVDNLADQVQSVLDEGGVPFLVGPTGAGKTSAIRAVALRNGWAFEEVAGSQSFADADLVGLRTDKQELPGIFARAFKRARDGQPVLLFLDELLRFNVRAQDILMRPLQVAPVEIAQAMGLEVTEAVRIVEAPLWGIEHAPAHIVHLVFAANPWGSVVDPALIRRVVPIEVNMADAVADLFVPKLADAIRASWKAVARGELPLPIEYQSLSTAASANDVRFLRTYLLRLRVLDQAAADGFGHLLSGLGIDPASGL